MLVTRAAGVPKPASLTTNGALVWSGSAWVSQQIADAQVAAGAAIAESKLSLASDAAAATASRRSLGYSSVQAAAGSDVGFEFLPRHHSLLGWNFPNLFAFTSFAGVNGVVQLCKIMVPQTISVTNVEVIVAVVNTTPVSSQNFAALFKSDGTQIGVSADQGVNWGSTGARQSALTGGPFSVTGGTDVFVWAAFLQNAATPFTYGAYSNALFTTTNNLHLTAAQSRFGTSGTVQTAMPGSFTPSAITQTIRNPWAGLS